jgi:hypothetical protein
MSRKETTMTGLQAGGVRRTMAWWVVLAGLMLFAAPAAPSDLADLIPNLFDQEIFLKPPGPGQFDHSTHFLDQSGRLQATGSALNSALVSELSTFPLPSTSGGFTYSYDPAVGSFTRTSDSFGPLFTERAYTIGKHKWNAGISYLTTSYDKIDDLDLGGGDLVFHLLHGDTNQDATRTNFFFEGDLIGADTSIDLETYTSTVFFTYGITDRFDVAVAAPFVNVDLDASATLTILPLATSHEAVPLHVFDDNTLTRVFSDSGTASGIGDMLVRAKYRVTGEHERGIAVAVDLRLPTGNENDLLGTGATQAKLFAIGSTSWGSFSPHLNLGYTFSSGGGDVTGDIPDEYNYSLGLDWAVHPKVTLEADFVGRTLRDVLRLESRQTDFAFCATKSTAPGPPLCAPGGTAVAQLAELNSNHGDLDVWLGAAGLRFNPWKNLLISANALFSLGDEGLQIDGVTPVASVEYSF